MMKTTPELQHIATAPSSTADTTGLYSVGSHSMLIRGIPGSTDTSSDNFLVLVINVSSLILVLALIVYIADPEIVMMCFYGKAIAEHGNCDKPQRHKIERRLTKRCENSPKGGPRCSIPTHDPNLDALPSTKGGPCLACRDSRISVVIYKTIWVTYTVQNLLKIVLTCIIGGSPRLAVLGKGGHIEVSAINVWDFSQLHQKRSAQHS